MLPRWESHFRERQFTQPKFLVTVFVMRYRDWILREADVLLGQYRELHQALKLWSVPDFTTVRRFL